MCFVGNEKWPENCVCSVMCARAYVYIKIHFYVLPPYAYRRTKIASRTTSYRFVKWTDGRVGNKIKEKNIVRFPTVLQNMFHAKLNDGCRPSWWMPPKHAMTFKIKKFFISNWAKKKMNAARHIRLFSFHISFHFDEQKGN